LSGIVGDLEESKRPDARLCDPFEAEQVADDAFDAVLPDAGMGRPFGGHLMGLAIRAAAGTVNGAVSSAPHSLHARFVRVGRAAEPLRLTVERVHDGRTIAVRRVTAAQAERVLLTADLSFHAAVGGEHWQPRRDRRRVPEHTAFSPLGGVPALAPFEIRAEYEHVRGAPARLHPFWARAREAPPDDDPVLPVCGLAVLTDVGVTASARKPGSPLRVQRAAVTLDHALWLHAPFRLDEWLQVAVDPVVNAAGCGLARGEVSRADGTLVASFVQEVLLRLPADGGR
jgi:acyl-CoA thioesterase II